jgi:hypothetical protein
MNYEKLLRAGTVSIATADMSCLLEPWIPDGCVEDRSRPHQRGGCMSSVLDLIPARGKLSRVYSVK